MEDPQMLAAPAPPVQEYHASSYGDYMSVSNPSTLNAGNTTHFNPKDESAAQISGPPDGNVNLSFSQTGVVVDGSGSIEAETGMVEKRYGGEMGTSTEEDRLWSIVRTNGLDFNAWTALILETEKENNIQKLRAVYDPFLAEFPLCYGYWKKYADHEARLSGAEKVVEVYERAVLAVTYSVDIWIHYCEFAIQTYDDPDTIRRLFERGLAYVGTDYLSSPLWDEYIKYEYSRQAWSHVAMIYTRVLENPIQHFDRYLNSLKELSLSRPLSEIRTPEEADLAAVTTVPTDEVGSEVHPESVDQSTKTVSAGLSEAEELEKYIAIREDTYKKAKEFESKIIGFETAIRRPYFHVRPLDDPEIENWHSYLDFIERGDDFNKVVKLYERCLIACANYPEFWIRYVLCMEATGSMELANNALARATQVFVKKRPEIHIFSARFKENHNDIPGARAEFQLLHSEISPGYLEAVVKHANMEYRLGNKEAAFSVFEEAIAAERGKELSQVLPMLLVQYSRFQFLVMGDVERAREILSGGFEQVQLSRPLVEAIIHLESLLPRPKRIDYVDSLVEKFIAPNPENPNAPSTADREDVSNIYLEFLDLFGDAQSIKRADTRHCALFLRHRSLSVSRKRHAEDYMDSEKAKLARNYASQAQWASSYGPAKPAPWPAPVPTTQAQPWNPAYATQGAYGYGAYAAYAQPQVATSAPPAAAYGAYPTTGYQPAAAAAAVAAYGQHPTTTTAAGPGYYGAYY